MLQPKKMSKRMCPTFHTLLCTVQPCLNFTLALISLRLGCIHKQRKYRQLRGEGTRIPVRPVPDR